MNYLGHSAVASWFSSEPMFLLGSMVPDFAAFLQISLPEPRDAMLEAGIALHHETDRVFHEARTFRDLNRAAAQALAEANLPRGPARAVAHVGVEMLIDVAMADSPTARRTFQAALGTLEPQRLRETLPMDEGCHARLAHTAAAVRARGAALWTPEPMAIASRITRTFANRRRLEIDAGTVPTVALWVDSTLHRVRVSLPALEAELLAGIRFRWPARFPGCDTLDAEAARDRRNL